jgi:hypothetical protein
MEHGQNRFLPSVQNLFFNFLILNFMELLSVMLISYFFLFLVFAYTERHTIFKNLSDSKKRYWDKNNFQDHNNFF